MKLSYSKIIIGMSMFLILSCGKSRRDLEQVEISDAERKRDSIAAVNKNAIEELQRKYQAIGGWDTLPYFTFTIQDLFQGTSKLMRFDGEILDISRKDTAYELKVHQIAELTADERTRWISEAKKALAEGVVRVYVAIISLTHKQMLGLFEQLKQKQANDQKKELCFVLKVLDVVSQIPRLKADVNAFEDEFELDYEFDFQQKMITIKAELVDFYVTEK